MDSIWYTLRHSQWSEVLSCENSWPTTQNRRNHLLNNKLQRINFIIPDEILCINSEWNSEENSWRQFTKTSPGEQLSGSDFPAPILHNGKHLRIIMNSVSEKVIPDGICVILKLKYACLHPRMKMNQELRFFHPLHLYRFYFIFFSQYQSFAVRNDLKLVFTLFYTYTHLE